MIFVSSSCVKNSYIKDSVGELAEMGFTNIELSGGTSYYEGYLDDLMALKRKYRLNYQVHNYFPPPREDFVLNLIDADERNYERSEEMIRLSLDLSKRLGATSYAFHPGYTVDMSPRKKGAYFDYKGVENQDKGAKEDIFYERFEMLLNSLPHNHLPIAIENLFPFNSEEDFSLFSHPDEITGFLNRYCDNPKAGLLLDLGHLNVASYYLGFDAPGFVDRLFSDFPEKIFSVHLSDNNGTADMHMSSKKGSWQISVVEKHRDLLNSIPVTLEWHDLKESRNRVSSLMGLIKDVN